MLETLVRMDGRFMDASEYQAIMDQHIEALLAASRESKLNTWFAAYEAGEERAESLEAGDVWLGAIPEAIKAGYGGREVERRLFQHGFLDKIAKRFPRGVTTTSDCKIVI